MTTSDASAPIYITSMVRDINGTLVIGVPTDIVVEHNLESRVRKVKNPKLCAYQITPKERERLKLRDGQRYDFVVMLNDPKQLLFGARPVDSKEEPPIAAVTVETTDLHEEPVVQVPPTPIVSSLQESIDQFIRTPEMDMEMTHYVPRDDLRLFSDVLALRTKSGAIVNVDALGEKATGKTSYFKWHAARHKLPFFSFPSAQVRDEVVWWGMREFENNNTVYNKSMLAHALSKGHCVVLFDEIDRADPRYVTSLFDLLDFRRETYLPYSGNQRLTVAPGTVIAMTANGMTDPIATYERNLALQSRMATRLEFTLPDMNLMVDSIMARTGADRPTVQTIVDIAERIREAVASSTNTAGRLQHDVDIRQMLEVAYWIQNGLPVHQAYQICFSNHYSATDGGASERMVVDQILQSAKVNVAPEQA